MNKRSEKIYLFKNGLLFLLEILPRESIKKEYGILKLYSLMPNHSDNAVTYPRPRYPEGIKARIYKKSFRV
ncbi:MAG: hypothetical protein ACTSQP_01475 [Promethearchaeota archaeon]